MSVSQVRGVLLWCWVINYVMLIWWFLLFLFFHDGFYRLHQRWFRLTVEQFDAINFAGIVLYKLGVILFNLVPWIALWTAG